MRQTEEIRTIKRIIESFFDNDLDFFKHKEKTFKETLKIFQKKENNTFFIDKMIKNFENKTYLSLNSKKFDQIIQILRMIAESFKYFKSLIVFLSF